MIYRTFSGQERKSFFFVVTISTFSAALELLTASIFVVLVEVIYHPEKSISYLERINMKVSEDPITSMQFFLLLFGVFYLIKNAYLVFDLFFQNYIVQKISYRVKNKLFEKYSRMQYVNFLTRNSSFGLTVINQEAEQMFLLGVHSLCAAFADLLVISALVGFIVYMNPGLSISILAISFFIFLFLKKVLFPFFQNLGKDFQEAYLLANKYLLQFFHAFKEVSLLDKKGEFFESFRVNSRKVSKIHAIKGFSSQVPRFVTETFLIGIFIFMICFISMNYANPQAQMGVIGGYLYIGFRILPLLNRMIHYLNSIKYATPSICRVCEELNQEYEEEAIVSEEQLTFHKQLELKNVSFCYQNVERASLNQLSLKVMKGECIGVVGPTGSGKSTLIDLILGLLKPYEGEVLIDGQYPANSKQWHQLIGYVPQSIYLTDDTIQANIAFGEKPGQVNQERLEKAIEAAQLTPFIAKLDKGKNTIVGERGVRLSGGERQRIAIARALYRNPEVLIFDEATSALDSKTEEKLMKTIYAVSQNRTVIMVAHRLTTLKNCDRIIYINEGKIARESTYDELAANESLEKSRRLHQ